MAGGPIDRRAFLASAGAAALSALPLPTLAQVRDEDALFASAFTDGEGRHGVALMTEDGRVLARWPLPARGHDVVFAPGGGEGVAFARRPGTFALAFSTQGKRAPTVFHNPAGRHFYGHGVFSTDGRLLYATENDYEAAKGIIGVYDATDGYRRLGEFASGGVGPHDILLSGDGATLVIANGGIETHPDFGRAKLNLSTMQPNITLIDRHDGTIIATERLPSRWQRLSLRHMATSANGDVFIGGQVQSVGPSRPRGAPLLARLTPGRGLSIVDLPEADLAALAGYVGSVAANADGDRIAVSSPHGNTVLVLDAVGGAVLSRHRMPAGCGLAGTPSGGFVASSSEGAFGQLDQAGDNPGYSGLSFDNHITAG